MTFNCGDKMKTYSVTEHNWQGIRTSREYSFAARNKKSAIRKFAIFLGYTPSKRYDKVEQIEDGFYIVANKGVNFRAVHSYKFSAY